MPVINIGMKTIYSLVLVGVGLMFVSMLPTYVNAQTHPRKPVKRVKGTVKWFNDAKNFGFLLSDSGKDVFVDKTAAKGSLKEGACVTFEIWFSAKGATAKNIRKCPGGETPYSTKQKPVDPTFPKIPR
jgi:CspA family cold shock protein